EVVAVVGARSGPDVGQGMHRPVQDDPVEPAAVEIRLLGGLRVLVRGRPIDLPSGAVSVAVAVLALRRAVHVEELSTVLWPEAEAEVSRRRLRNVLTRIRQAGGPIVGRQGDRLELASAVVVDHHVLERRARRALSVPPGPDRRALVAAALE